VTDTIYTVQTPGVPDASEPGGITVGTVFRTSVNGTISQMRWFFPLTLPGVPVQGAIYLEGTQALLATATFSGTPVAGTWNTANLNVPVNITAAVNYIVAVWTDSRYVATAGQFTGTPITNGTITAPADDPGLHNGRFRTGGALQYPTDSFNGGGYFPDVFFEPLVDDTIAPDGFEVAVTLGAVTLSQPMGIVPDGISVNIGLGNVTLSEEVPPSPLGPDLVLAAGNLVKQCLCDAVALSTDPPKHCRFQVGILGFAGIDLISDECCEGVAYVALGDIYPSSESFPEMNLVRQISGRCKIEAWAAEFRVGIIRCAPTGTNTQSPTDAAWNAAALLNYQDAQILRRMSCCVRTGIEDAGAEFLGMNVIIGRQVQGPNGGGCVDRYVPITVQIPVCETC
jgi:Domain of unknown function (DUF4082)